MTRFNTTEYQFSHGRMPRGRGGWAFYPKSNETDVRFSPSMTYSEAKKWAAKEWPDESELVVGS